MRTYAEIHNQSQTPVSILHNRSTPEREPQFIGMAPPGFAHSFDRLSIHPPGSSVMQTKLAISAPGDACEQQADRVADQVMRMPTPPLLGAASECDLRPGFQAAQKQLAPERIQAKGVTSRYSGQHAVPRIVGDVVAAPGNALDPQTRDFMERRFGHDFSKVRVHADAQAAASACAMNARAYTIGHNVVFAARQFAPGTHAGKSLLAHELTHVIQQGCGSTSLQRQADEKPAAPGDLELPWKHGDYSLFEEKGSGIRFLVAASNDREPDIRNAIAGIGARVAEDNLTIKNPSSRVTTIIVAPTTTRFALWNGKPVLALDLFDVNMETAAHEMGHAIFYALKNRAESKSKDAAKAGNFRLLIADIYARLSQTQDFTDDDKTHPAGLWIADPSQWLPGGAREHPWQDPDEFFASAKEAYQVNRKGFESAIAKFTKIDSKVKAPADELLTLLDSFFKKGSLPAKEVPKARAATAKAELEGETGVSKIEDTSASSPLLEWLLNPGTRPQKRQARPSLESPY